MFRHTTYLPLLYAPLSYALGGHELLARQTITSYSPAQTTSCLNLAETCYPTVASCTATFCSACASIAGPDFISCCNGSNAASCISVLLGDATTTSSNNTATTTGTITHDPNAAACNSQFDLVSSCASATPGFTSLFDQEQASCLCYTASGSSTVYAPIFFDNLQASCVSYVSTADFADYTAFEGAAGLCTRVGNVRGGAGRANATTTAAMNGTMSTTSGGGALSTRTASLTSSSGSSSRTQSVVATSSTGGVGVPDKLSKYSQSWAFFLLGFGWLV